MYEYLFVSKWHWYKTRKRFYTRPAEGDLHNYVGLAPGASNDLVLFRIGTLAQIWAKQNKLELSIKPLTDASLNYSSSSYAELDSSIKAARARVLFEFVCKICLDVAT